MLGFVATAGQKFADTTDQVVSDATNYGPVGTTLALLEASGKFFSAIHKRLHKSQRDEFKILARINNEFLPTAYPYDIIGQSAEVFKQDFDGRIDVLPVSDPNIPSNSHRLAQAQLMLQLASQSPPGTFNMPEVNKAVLAAANVDSPERFMNAPQQAIQQDPLADIMSATRGQPIKAFPGQDHNAHIAVKTAYVQDPLNGANPIMKQVEPVLLANIREHMVLRFQEQMGGLMKAQEGQVDQGASLTAIMAESAQQILKANQLAAQGGLDSIEQQNLNIQKQAIENKKELELKDLQLKEKEIKIDAMVEAAKLDEKKKSETENVTAKVVMDLLKMMDKDKVVVATNDQQNLAAGGPVQATDMLKMAVDQAASVGRPDPSIPPVVKPIQPPMEEEEKEEERRALNFLEQAKRAQNIQQQPMEKEMSTEDINLLKQVRDTNLERFDLDNIEGGKTSAIKKIVNAGNYIKDVESDNNPMAKNPTSSAAGLYQFTKGALKTAVNRLKNTVGEDNLPNWAEDAAKHGDATKLDPLKQQILFEADMFQKKGSDKYLKDIIENDSVDALMDYYNKLHHTAPDEATNKRATEKLAFVDLTKDVDIA